MCSTYNFQMTSGLWQGLGDAATRLGAGVRVYVDAGACDGSSGPSASEIARQLAPGLVFRTRTFEGRPVRNHAKYVVLDHRQLLVTSANFSWSAENQNVEFGLLVSDETLAEGIERQVKAVEDILYERVK